MVCNKCNLDRQPINFASTRECAFIKGEFYDGNWNCGWMNRFREWIEKSNRVFWNDDQNCGVLPIPDSGEFLILGWYKSRGRTEQAYIMGDKIEPLTEEKAKEIIELFSKE
jgi:hypothetical protein